MNIKELTKKLLPVFLEILKKEINSIILKEGYNDFIVEFREQLGGEYEGKQLIIIKIYLPCYIRLLDKTKNRMKLNIQNIKRMLKKRKNYIGEILFLFVREDITIVKAAVNFEIDELYNTINL